MKTALVEASSALAQPMGPSGLAEWIRANADLLADAVEASGRIGSAELGRLILRGEPA